MLIWIALAIAILLLLVISQRDLALAMFTAAIVLGLMTLSPGGFLDRVYVTFADRSIIFLAVAVAVIAMIGGVLEESGGMEDLVKNMRIGKRPFLAASPALLGMLPMPGGALLSAPMVESSGKDLAGSTKAVLNVWFRHILFLIYPLGPALIASAKIAGLEVYQTIPYLFPLFAVAVILGYFYFLRETETRMSYDSAFSPRGLLVPLGIILLAPIADFLLKTFLDFQVSELATLVGVGLSLSAAWYVSKFDFSEMFSVVKKMKPWNYSLIIFGMFTFLNVFTASGAPEALGGLAIPLPVLVVVVSFLLGLATGRIQAPASIVIPIFLAREGMASMPLIAFALTFFSVFIGYVITPIHPCVSISVEYFDATVGNYVKKIAAPAFISIALAAVLSLFLL
ncbi:MAG: DUF401 family protein [Candidatus Bipolaricaulota bacterium]